jgi:putative resolvase
MMKLSEWARADHLHPKTAYRWWRQGTLPVPARQVSARTILVAQPQPATGGVGLYGRVSSHEQRTDLDYQVGRLSQWAANAGWKVAGVEAEVASGVSGERPRLRRLLADRRRRRWR